MIRSQCAFIRGACGALVRVSVCSAWKTASKAGVRGVSVTDEKARRVQAGAEVGGQIPRLLRDPASRRVSGDAREVQTSRAMLQEGEGGQALAECGVDVEEVDRDEVAGLVGQGLLPGGTASARSRG
jgi:hypothetical protein